ncbi:MAG TPA: tetratricopeptide repeat protein [Steroidobacteraceae bacterium]|nr:tetratricopeptide repeat protein [Steroidobacteraceae bacterium]
MEDYLSDKEQWEWVKAQLRANGPAMILALAVVLAGWAGWRWWQQRVDSSQAQASAQYMQMVQALERSDRSQALVVLGQLERGYPDSPYTDQAKLLAARLYVEGNELDKAATELSAVAAHSHDKELALVARQRLARVQIAQGKPDAALATLEGTEVGAFAARAHEVRGDALFAKGDRQGALREYRSAQSSAAGGSTPLLDLKIADLGGAAPPSATATAAAAK